VSLLDNTISGSGSNIDSSVAIGLLLASAVTTFPDQRGPDLAYDGAIDPTKLADAGAGGDGGVNANAMNICFKNNGAASTFLDINIQKLEIYGEGDAGPAPADGGPTNLPLIDSFNIAPFTCALPATSQVDGGVTFVDASPGASCDASHP